MTFVVTQPVERRGAGDGEAYLTSADTYRGETVDAILSVVQGVSESESEAGVHLSGACVTGFTGTGVRVGDRDREDKGDKGVFRGKMACALLLVVSSGCCDGS